ncbi:MAG: hypothetical protein AUH33_00790 [Chloroflexi bacterium 13_1_40CM_68_21]|nr:MAG: hypothetical protein AUH33_00790 [Chloroflexi bacterium 13_1_40CM_68_21]
MSERSLDASPVAAVALALMREATGRAEPLAPLVPARPAALRRGKRVGFWSLAAGAGATTVAALAAHRSAAGGEAPLLIDLDRWAPALALRAGLSAASITDALLQPGREKELVSRWSAVPFLPGAPSLHATFDAERVLGLVRECSAGRAAILDLGARRSARRHSCNARPARSVSWSSPPRTKTPRASPSVSASRFWRRCRTIRISRMTRSPHGRERSARSTCSSAL